MNEDSVDTLRNIFGKRKGGTLKKIEEDAGMPLGVIETMRITYGRGMEEGNVVFTPNEEGGGTLLIEMENEKGQNTQETREITNPDEASLLAGLQGEADRKRGK